jgi:lipopolysaccharide transport system permease protein
MTGYEVVLRPERPWFSFDAAGLWAYRDLLLLLVWRDFVAKYKQTILGPLWFIVQPLLMTLVFTVVFGQIFGLSTDGLPPVLFYLSGQLGWNYFAQNVTANANTLAGNAGLFSKVYFPRLIVPLAALVSNLFAAAVQAATFAAFFWYFRHVLHVTTFAVTWPVVFVPVLVVYTGLLSLAVGLLLSTVTAKYRDLTHLTALLVQVWMYATPVIYPLSRVPDRWQWIAAANPMTPVIESLRLMLLGAGTVRVGHAVASAAVTAILLVLGLAGFARVERTFVDVV